MPVTQVKVGDIPLLVKAVCLHLVTTPVKAELDQLAAWLDLFGILSFIRNHQLEAESLFVHDVTDRLTAERMIALFSVQYSEAGSTRRIAEDSVTQYWNEFVQDLYHEIISK